MQQQSLFTEGLSGALALKPEFVCIGSNGKGLVLHNERWTPIELGVKGVLMLMRRAQPAGFWKNMFSSASTLAAEAKTLGENVIENELVGRLLQSLRAHVEDMKKSVQAALRWSDKLGLPERHLVRFRSLTGF